MKRQDALEAINKMPKVFDVEELFEKLLFMEKVQKGLDQAEKGQTVSHEKVVRHFRQKWAK